MSVAADGATEHVYYSPATTKTVASCKVCGDTLGKTVAVGIGVLAAVAAVFGLVYAAHRYGLSAARKKRLAATLKKLNLGVKLKIIISFYQVATHSRTVPKCRS